MYKIGVVGVGVVGGAMLRSLQEKCQGSEYTVVGYDKYKQMGEFNDIIDADMVFLCLPTLYNDDLQEYDKSSIHDVCSGLASVYYPGLVVVKSTIEPTTCDSLAKQYGLSVAHNPEFLTASTAYEDFHDQRHVVIGTTSTTRQEHKDALIKFYQDLYPLADITTTNAVNSECIKIFCNTFYAVKIQYFNELYLACQKIGGDFQEIVKAMIHNGWINPMHTTVPGTDGKMSYGGMCFPKDTNALLSFMIRNDIPHQVLKSTVQERNSMRDD